MKEKTKRKTGLLVYALLALILLASFVVAGLFGAKAQNAVFADGETSGNCGVWDSEEYGDNAQWSYDAQTKTLTISGAGKMDYSLADGSSEPWLDLNVEKIIIGENITEIAEGALVYYDWKGIISLDIYVYSTSVNFGLDLANFDEENEALGSFCEVSRDFETMETSCGGPDVINFHVPSQRLSSWNNERMEFNEFCDLKAVDNMIDLSVDSDFSLIDDAQQSSTGIVTDIILPSIVILTSGIALAYVLSHKKKEQRI